jgi:hypothetical protein
MRSPKEFQELFIITNIASNNALPPRNIMDLRTGKSYASLVSVGAKDIVAFLKDCINKC